MKTATQPKNQTNTTIQQDNNNKAKAANNNLNHNNNNNNESAADAGASRRRKVKLIAKPDQNKVAEILAASAAAAVKPAGVAAQSTIFNGAAVGGGAAATTSAPNTINKTVEMLRIIPEAVVDNNLDSVLTDVKQLDNTCDFQRCRVKTSLIGQDCRLCKQRFCMKHQLPEVHGCGNAIKKTERTEFTRPRQSLPISAALRRNEHKDAHTRLEQKLKEMSLARQKARKWMQNKEWEAIHRLNDMGVISD